MKLSGSIIVPLLLSQLVIPRLGRGGQGGQPDPESLDPQVIFAADKGWSRAERLAQLERQHPYRDSHYWSASALLMVGLKSSALQRFGQVLRLGPGPFFEEAAEKLVEDLAFPLDLTWPREHPLDLSGMSPRVRERWAHKLGLHFIRLGELKSAQKWLRGLPSRAQARYLLATLLLHQGQKDQARRQLQACSELAARSDQVEMGELAQLALARLDLEEERLPSARQRYLQIPLGSPHFFRARQELAWLYLRQGEPERALAQRLILQSQPFDKYFYPDGLMVEAAALFARCYQKRARATAQGMQKKMVESLEALALFLRHRPEDRHYYLEAMASAAGRSQALHPDYVKALLADASFRRALWIVRQLQRERGLLAHSGAKALQREIATELDLRLVAAQQEAGVVTRRVLSALSAELRALRQRSEEIIFEVERSAAVTAIRRRSGPVVISPARETPRLTGTRDEGWPYRGELWSDEINHLVVRLPSRCSMIPSSSRKGPGD